jgi:hypothetical protein
MTPSAILDPQKRQHIDKVLKTSPDDKKSFSEQTSDLIEILGLGIPLSDIIGHNIAIRHIKKTKTQIILSDTTAYTSIAGYNISQQMQAVQLMVKAIMNPIQLCNLQMTRGHKRWSCTGTDESNFNLSRKWVRFSNQASQNHLPIFKSLGIPEKIPVNEVFVIAETSKKIEFCVTLQSLSVDIDNHGCWTVRIYPHVCSLDHRGDIHLTFRQGHHNWSMYDGTETMKGKIAKVFF